MDGMIPSTQLESWRSMLERIRNQLLKYPVDPRYGGAVVLVEGLLLLFDPAREDAYRALLEENEVTVPNQSMETVRATGSKTGKREGNEKVRKKPVSGK
jgi:hypothetical protein